VGSGRDLPPGHQPQIFDHARTGRAVKTVLVALMSLDQPSVLLPEQPINVRRSSREATASAANKSAHTARAANRVSRPQDAARAAETRMLTLRRAHAIGI
jgi:hypothetical protein